MHARIEHGRRLVVDGGERSPVFEEDQVIYVQMDILIVQRLFCIHTVCSHHLAAPPLSLETASLEKVVVVSL